MTSAMLKSLRTLLHQAITSPRGDSVAPIRVSKQIAKDLNDLLHQPLCSPDELAKREAGAKRLRTTREAHAKRLEELRKAPRAATKAPRAPAPVMVYFEKDRNARELARVKELL